MAPRFVRFETQGDGVLAVGADALLYVMAHNHALSVPTQALEWAIKVGVIGIARRATPEGVLRDVNRALDIAAATLRSRAKLDAEEAAAAATQPVAEAQQAPKATNGGTRVPRVPRPSPLAPKGSAADIRAELQARRIESGQF